ncbi:transporter, partial [Sulfolobus sp. B5]
MQRVIVSFLRWILPLSVVWGLSFPLTKIITFSISPMIVSVARVAVGSIFFYLLGRGISIGIKQFINALLNFIIFLSFLNLGINFSPNPGLVAIMVYTQPVFVLLIEYFLGNRISTKGIIGVILGVIGVISSATLSFNLGLLFGIIASLSWAGGTIYYSRKLTNENLIKLNAFMTLISIPFLSALTPIDYYFNYNLFSLILLVILALLAQVMGFYFWFNGVKELGSIYASSGALLVPV